MDPASRRLPPLRKFWPSALVLLACVLATTSIGNLARLRDRAELESRVLNELHANHVQLARVAETTFSATAGLETLLYTQGGLTQHSFGIAVDHLLSHQTHLRSVVAAPDNVVAYLHPIAGNERVMGLNYRSLPTQWAQIERARQLRQPLVFAPVPLVQGGFGVIQRRPVFLKDAKGDERYWGTVSAVADLERFVATAGLPGSTLTLALMERRNDGQLGDLIWGDPDLHRTRHLREDLQLPGATWTLLGRPHAGWGWTPWQGHWLWMSASISLVLVLMSALLTKRRLDLTQRGQALEREASARRLSQNTAEEATARLQALLHTASDWLWEQTADLRLSYVSLAQDGSEPGRTLHSAVGGWCWKHPMRVPGMPSEDDWQAHRLQQERHEPFRNFEYALRLPSGDTVWLSVSGDPVFDTKGQFAGYRGTGRDVTAVRRAQQALARANQELSAARDRLQAVLDAAIEVAIVATDAQGRITIFNRGAERLLGYAPEDVMGLSPQMFHEPGELQVRRNALSEELGRSASARELFTHRAEVQGMDTQPWTYLRRDGSRLPVSLSLSPIHDAQGKPLGYLGVAIDLSQQEQAQTALRTSALRLQAVFDSADAVAIVVMGLDWRIHTMNRGAERVLGCSPEDAVGRLVLDFHAPGELQMEAERLQISVHEVLARQAADVEGGHTRIWTLQRLSDGHAVRVSHTSTHLVDAGGQHVGYVAIARDITEEERTRALLDEERALMASILSANIDVAVIATDLEGRIVIFSRGAERMLGYSAAEMLGHSPLRLHAPHEVEAAVRDLSVHAGRPGDAYSQFAALAGRQAGGQLIWTCQRKDGRLIKVSQVLSSLRDAHGVDTGYLGVMSDITEQQAAEQALRDANARLQAMLDASLEVGIWLLDAQGRVLTFNKGAERLLDLRAADVLGQSTAMLHEPDELQRRLDALTQEMGRPAALLDLLARQARQPPGFRTREWVFVRRDGSRLRVSLSMAEIRDEQDHLLGYLGMGRDIEPQLAQEQQLREARDRLQAVLDGALEVGIVVTDSTDTITLFNRGAERLFGYAQHEVLGRPWSMLHGPQEGAPRQGALGLHAQAPRASGSGGADPAQDAGPISHWSFMRKNAEPFTGALRLSRLSTAENEAPSRLAIVLDISEQLQAQRALEQLNRELEARAAARSAELRRTLSTLTQAQSELMRTERMAALGSLVAGVAHELNTPLGTCLTAASTLQDRTKELVRDLREQQLRRSSLESYVDDAEAMSDLLLRGLRNASDLVAHFKQLSVDQTSDQRRPFQLGTVVADVLTVMGPQLKQSRLRIESAVELPQTIDSYPGELGRLLTNLVQNAQLHAFEPGAEGLLRISAQPLDAEHFELEIGDNGQGMTPEVRRRAFDPFFTTKLGKGGSGLGLNIVFNIATGVLGGEVKLHSKLGKGTRFVFRLPFKAPQRQRAGADAPAAP